MTCVTQMWLFKLQSVWLRRVITMAEYIVKDKVEWYKCKADITIGDKDFGNTRIVVIPVADISELPTIDIITCKDCKHSNVDKMGWYCNKHYHRYANENTHFCSDGEAE